MKMETNISLVTRDGLARAMMCARWDYGRRGRVSLKSKDLATLKQNKGMKAKVPNRLVPWETIVDIDDRTCPNLAKLCLRRGERGHHRAFMPLFRHYMERRVCRIVAVGVFSSPSQPARSRLESQIGRMGSVPRTSGGNICVCHQFSWKGGFLPVCWIRYQFWERWRWGWKSSCGCQRGERILENAMHLIHEGHKMFRLQYQSG